jgi:Ca2+-binding EF-hand superfamily protein
MRMTFTMFDFDGDGYVSKEDVRILLSYVPFRGGRAKSPMDNTISCRGSSPMSQNIIQEGTYYQKDKDYNERVEEQDKILMFLD